MSKELLTDKSTLGIYTYTCCEGCYLAAELGI
jgi:hypothetical protein